jgi:hypothetical protein
LFGGFCRSWWLLLVRYVLDSLVARCDRSVGEANVRRRDERERGERRSAEGDQECPLVLERRFENVRLDDDQHEHDRSDQRCGGHLQACDATDQGACGGVGWFVAMLGVRGSRCLSDHGESYPLAPTIESRPSITRCATIGRLRGTRANAQAL